jgi:EAL domain-containing protein (putative c-di-GMP-specific phosphodiesterase class I)
MLDTMIIGEGIETDTEIEFARTLGMDYLQGYKFSRPMPLQYWQQHLKD